MDATEKLVQWIRLLATVGALIAMMPAFEKGRAVLAVARACQAGSERLGHAGILLELKAHEIVREGTP